eukprot:m.26826 g.26826  ORF g.26826 m.26826 type:complete len:516 (+) comp29546_c0_seq1:133-1680(+)
MAFAKFCACFLLLGLSVVQVDVAKTKAKVLILGGGVAGLQAAYNLKEKGINDILLIEADNKVGGRLLSGHLNGLPTDSAAWETDPVHPDRNTLGEMLSLCNVGIRDIGLSSTVYIDEDGNDVSAEAAKSQKVLNNAIGKLSTDWKTGLLTEKDNPSVHAALRLHGWHPRTAIDSAVEVFSFDAFLGLDPIEQATSYYMYLYGPGGYSATTKFHAGGEGEPFSTQKFITCMKNLVFTENDERLQLGKRVTEVAYSANGVNVTTEGGIQYEGDYAIVTFSLGVLQQEFVAFQPPLPYKKRLAINEFTMVPLTFIWARFNTTVSVNSTRYLFYLYVSSHRGDYHWNRDVLTPVRGFNATYDVLRFWLQGAPALRVERQSIEETKRELNEIYMEMFGIVPVSIDVSRLNYEPLYYGGFRGWPTGASFDEFDELRAPLLDRLFFAGDAYQVPIYARAASISGKETVDVIVSCMKGQSCSYKKYGASYSPPACPSVSDKAASGKALDIICLLYVALLSVVF